MKHHMGEDSHPNTAPTDFRRLSKTTEKMLIQSSARSLVQMDVVGDASDCRCRYDNAVFMVFERQGRCVDTLLYRNDEFTDRTAVKVDVEVGESTKDGAGSVNH